MEVHPVLHPVVALLAGILILIFPAILNYIVAFYLIIIGVIGVIGAKQAVAIAYSQARKSGAKLPKKKAKKKKK
jgi:hypothetical protein